MCCIVIFTSQLSSYVVIQDSSRVFDFSGSSALILGHLLGILLYIVVNLLNITEIVTQKKTLKYLEILSLK